MKKRNTAKRDNVYANKDYILELAKNKKSYAAIALQFNVSESYIREFLKTHGTKNIHYGKRISVDYTDILSQNNIWAIKV
jgi:hypothetical protein